MWKLLYFVSLLFSIRYESAQACNGFAGQKYIMRVLFIESFDYFAAINIRIYF